jgi:hypothetical protein
MVRRADRRMANHARTECKSYYFIFRMLVLDTDMIIVFLCRRLSQEEVVAIMVAVGIGDMVAGRRVEVVMVHRDKQM